MRCLLLLLLLFSLISANFWHCGVGALTHLISYGLVFGDEEVNVCCEKHDVDYDASNINLFAKWAIRKAADGQMLHCMTKDNPGKYRYIVSYTFYHSCRFKNWLCENSGLFC